MSTTRVAPTSVQPWGPTGPAVLLPGHTDYDTGANRSLTRHLLANVRTATVAVAAAEGGGLSVVPGDTTITGITPPLTAEMAQRAIATGRVGRVDTSANPVTPGFVADHGLTAPLIADASTTSLVLPDVPLNIGQHYGDVVAGTHTITNVGHNAGRIRLTSAQIERMVGGTITGKVAAGTQTLFSGAGSAGTFRAKIDAISPDGATITLSAGSTIAETLVGAELTLYPLAGYALAAGTWNVQIVGSGADVSNALNWWMADGLGIGTDGKAAGSGASTIDRGIIQLRAGLTYWIEEGIQFGQRSKANVKPDYVDDAGVTRVWPQRTPHWWQHWDLDLNGATLWQQDPTNYDAGARTTHANATADSTTIVLTAPLSTQLYNRFLLGGATIQSVNNAKPRSARTGILTSGNVSVPLSAPLSAAWAARVRAGGATIQTQTGAGFPGGTYGATILSLSSDNLTLTVAAGQAPTVSGTVPVYLWFPESALYLGTAGSLVRGAHVTAIDPSDRKTCTVDTPALRDSTLDEAVTIYFAPLRAERAAGVQIVAWDAPGSWAGVERAGINRDCLVYSSNGPGFIRGSNPTYASGITNLREEWPCFAPAMIDGLTIGDTIVCQYHWSDGVYLAPRSQVGIDNADCDVENMSVLGTRFDGCGRHLVTAQGQSSFLMEGVVATGVERLMCDNESTSPQARMLSTVFRSCAVSQGTANYHTSPATLNGEPPRSILVTTTAGSALVTVEKDVVSSDRRGAIIAGSGFPDDAYILRRLSPTLIEMSVPCTTTGTRTVLVGSEVICRDFTMDQIGVLGGTIEYCANYGVPGSRVYFTAQMVGGTDDLTDIVFDPRDDGLTYTLADFSAGTPIRSIAGGGVPASGGVGGAFYPRDIDTGARSLRMVRTIGVTEVAALCGFSTGADRAISAVLTAGSRAITAASKPWDTLVDKGRLMSGTGIRSGTSLLTASKGAATMDLPATTTGTVTVTESGRARFYVVIGASEFTGLTLRRFRQLDDARWAGSGVWGGQIGVPCFLVGLRQDGVLIEENFCVGARTGAGAVTRYMVGTFAGGPFVYGAPGGAVTDFVSRNNLGYDLVDNQMGTPTVTATVTMTVDDNTSATPVFSGHVTFSDARIAEGETVALWRADVAFPVDAGILDASNNFTIPIYRPLATDKGVFQFNAVWGNLAVNRGSFDTLADASPAVFVNPSGASGAPTTTTLSVAPSSPQPAGTAETLTAVVSPVPGAGIVTFKDGATVLGAVEVDPILGSAILDIPAGFTAGTHALTAVFGGNIGYTTSTGSSTYVASAPAAPTATTTVLTGVPSTVAIGATVTLTAAVSPTPTGGTVTYKDGAVVLGVVSVGDPLDVVFDTSGPHSLSAVYSGNVAYTTSTGTLTYTVTEPDTTAPEVASTSPFDGQSHVARTTLITVTFTEPVTAPAIALRTAFAIPFEQIPGTLRQVDGPGAVWEFEPVDRLDNDAMYVIVVDDATDAAGNHMAGRYSASFTVTANLFAVTGAIRFGALSAPRQ